MKKKKQKANSTLNGQFEKYKCSVIRSIRHEIEMLLERSVYTVTQNSGNSVS